MPKTGGARSAPVRKAHVSTPPDPDVLAAQAVAIHQQKTGRPPTVEELLRWSEVYLATSQGLRAMAVNVYVKQPQEEPAATPARKRRKS